MRFIRFTSAEHQDGVYGIINGDGKIEVIRGWLFDSVEKTGEVLGESDIIRYLPPVDPPNIVAIGLNYAAHAAEMKEVQPAEPLFFMKPTSSVIGHGGTVVLPAMAPDAVDYEAELCVVIGRKARHVSEEEALDYIFGYTCGMDVSARDCQHKDGQWIRAKGFDTFAPLGPWIETDLDHSNSRVCIRVNGNVLQDDRTSNMMFSVSRLVSYLSRWSTLYPGTVIMTGTPSGVGYKRNPPVFLRPGDVCEIDIEGIGVLKVDVAAEQLP